MTVYAPAPQEMGIAVDSSDSSSAGALATRQPNHGLLWQRFLPVFCEERFRKDSLSRPIKEELDRWFGRGVIEWYARAARLDPGLLSELHRRRQADPAVTWLNVEATSPLVVGVGNPSPLEAGGLAFEHTWGFPILPGASLKGLARHYFEDELCEMGSVRATKAVLSTFGLPAETRRAYQEKLPPDAADASAHLFGDGGRGRVVFLDGWPLHADDGWYRPDVLTPHHPEYHRGQRAVADDTESPHILPFLVVREGTRFSIGLTGGSVEVGLAAAVLERALDEWGVGGRTGAGYGQMRRL